jgi:aminopeptidase N
MRRSTAKAVRGRLSYAKVRRSIAALALSVAALFAASPAHAITNAAGFSATAAPSPGAAGLGDRLNPGIGNGGYDVIRYDLHLRYATSDPAQALDGDETILARATQSLSRFDLDFGGDKVGGVSVNGKPAAFKRNGEELIVTPHDPLPDGKRFTVSITHFTATPTRITNNIHSTAFFVTPDGSATAPQPYDAHLIYPCNDHPRDKATFTFTFDVPAGTDAIANGVEVGHSTHDGRTTWTYAMDEPMATELTQLAVGDWDFSTPQRHDGVVLRDVTAPSLTAFMQPALALEPSQLDYMLARVGRYPFDTYGTLIVNANVGFALETQTLSLFGIDFFTIYGQGIWDPAMLHELSHMWFGDSVSPYAWSDLWLNEGHASWYEFNYAESTGQLEEDTEDYPDPQGYATLDGLMRAVYAHGDEWRKQFGPVALPKSGEVLKLFSRNVYHGGALVLYALRQKIGTDVFNRLERAWVERYAGQSASTDDFIALASQVSGQDVTGFLRDWLYGETTPPMPGHPDWTVNPVGGTKSPAAPAAPALRGQH